MQLPDHLPDCRPLAIIKEDHERADQYTKPGSVAHFLHRQGFFPNNEKDAETMLVRIIREMEWYSSRFEDTQNTIKYLKNLLDENKIDH